MAQMAPTMALRSYLCLRLSAVGVIAVLTASLIKEYSRAGDCLQGSISAYDYTTVQSVFVGTLVTLGLVMIVLWGKTPWEDGALNLAGMVAPVVAFVPTAPSNLCGLTNSAGAPVTTEAAKDKLVAASHDGIFNNMLAYLVVVGLTLVILAGFGFVAHRRQLHVVTDHPVAYWFPLVLAAGLWGLGAYAFWQHREWFYDNAHGYAATTLLAFIIVVVINIGIQKLRREDDDSEVASRWWVRIYWGLAAMMVGGADLILLLAKPISHNFYTHRTFIVEAWLIFLLAVFWLIQTWDRRNDGAPPRTDQELQRAGAAPPQETGQASGAARRRHGRPKHATANLTGLIPSSFRSSVTPPAPAGRECLGGTEVLLLADELRPRSAPTVVNLKRARDGPVWPLHRGDTALATDGNARATCPAFPAADMWLT